MHLDLTKACNSLDRERTLKTMVERGIGPRLLRRIKHYWDTQKIAPCQRGCHGPIITPQRGLTQGSLKSCNEFNVMVDAVI